MNITQTYVFITSNIHDFRYKFKNVQNGRQAQGLHNYLVKVGDRHNKIPNRKFLEHHSHPFRTFTCVCQFTAYQPEQK